MSEIYNLEPLSERIQGMVAQGELSIEDELLIAKDFVVFPYVEPMYGPNGGDIFIDSNGAIH